ncbi:N-acetylmuramoyl-L-alanine amidase [Croceivirga thetidis]|uniref:N-acetylmuramoyl-L-alanine amidase n=1 Tax=Croceivirga thetidis TaxID=2721623 RepID=A0ABX1GLW7_9FLAO|nr:N-acetylmuramoyl-L-alanine amidase [Croceivirga thetidis]NKI30907.1 hypothetical protein [Croceivirga thetidis]
MSKIKNIVLDFGHGGIDKNGNYTTAPNKMFTYANGEVAYEGFLNRQIGGLLELYLKSNHPKYNIVTPVKVTDSRDIGLSYRVQVANQFKASETILFPFIATPLLTTTPVALKFIPPPGSPKVMHWPLL